MRTVRLTMAQALVRYLCAQRTETDGGEAPLFGGVWAIFGHGNVAGLGEALHAAQAELPTLRAHNEQAMAHAAIAFAKAHARRRMMACTTSIGPGATNMVTAAAVAHVNRLPVLLLPGDVFANRRPGPGPPAGRGLRRSRRSPPTTASGPSRGTGTGSRAPSSSSRASRRRSRSSRTRPPAAPRRWPCPRTSRRRPSTTPSTSSSRASTGSAAPGADPAELAAVADRLRRARAAPPRRRRRRPLLPGRRRRCAPSPSATASRSPRPRPARARCPGTIPASVGAIGVTRLERRQRAGRRRRRRPRRRDPPGGLPHRLPRPLPGPEPGPGGAERRPARRRQARRPAPRGGRAPRSRGALGRPRRLAGARRAGRRRARRLTAEWTRLVDAATGERPGRPGDRGAGDRRGEPRRRPARRGRVRRGRPAGRAEPALAHPRSPRLPPRVRLLLHGVRDRRRARREAGAPRPRGLRHGGRRQLPHDELGDRHVGRDAPEARRSSLLDNRGFGCINRLQQACGGASFNNLLGPEAPAIDFAGARAEPRGPRRAGQDGRRPRGRPRAGAPGRPDGRRGHRDRPGAALHRAAARGGTFPCPKSRPGPRSGPRARRTTRRAAASEPGG